MTSSLNEGPNAVGVQGSGEFNLGHSTELFDVIDVEFHHDEEQVLVLPWKLWVWYGPYTVHRVRMHMDWTRWKLWIGRGRIMGTEWCWRGFGHPEVHLLWVVPETYVFTESQSQLPLSSHDLFSFALPMVLDEPLIVSKAIPHLSSLALHQPGLKPGFHLFEVLVGIQEVHE